MRSLLITGIGGALHTLANVPECVAYGGGVDSTAMLIGMRDHGMKPDLILTADTGSEKPETYAYLPAIQEWLVKQGFPPVTMVKNKSPIAGDQSLHDECLRKNVLPSLAYGGHSCSIKWKMDPQLKYTKEYFGWFQPRKKRGAATRADGWFKHGPLIVKYVGYDAGKGDARRINRAKDLWPPGHYNMYPLKDWGWDRAKCIEVIIKEGMPGWNPKYLAADLVTFTRFEWIEVGGVPCKSACFMCPASQIAEIEMLQNTHPELMDVALDMEARAVIKGLRTVKGLGRNKHWGDTLKALVATKVESNLVPIGTFDA